MHLRRCRLNENYARHSDPNLRIEQKVLWSAFLTQVVRTLPPWESEIFTFMRPNELFGLTTEMWGTRLSADAPAGDTNGPQRQSFWICGIVARQRNTAPKTSAIQPRNPLIQQSSQQHGPTSHQVAPTSSRVQGFSAPSLNQSSRLLETVASRPRPMGYQNAPMYSSARSIPYSGNYASQAAPQPSMHVSLGSRPISPQQRNGPNPHVAPRNSISGYVASAPLVPNGTPARADQPHTSTHAPATQSHGTTILPSYRYMLPGAQPSSMPFTGHTTTRPVLPPPPDLAARHRDELSNAATSPKSPHTSRAYPQNGLPPLRDQRAEKSGPSGEARQPSPR